MKVDLNEPPEDVVAAQNPVQAKQCKQYQLIFSILNTQVHTVCNIHVIDDC